MSVYIDPDKLEPRLPHGLIKIIISGADDTYLEQEWLVSDETERNNKIAELKRFLENDLPNPLTKDWLRKQGYTVY